MYAKIMVDEDNPKTNTTTPDMILTHSYETVTIPQRTLKLDAAKIAKAQADAAWIMKQFGK